MNNLHITDEENASIDLSVPQCPQSDFDTLEGAVDGRGYAL